MGTHCKRADLGDALQGACLTQYLSTPRLPPARPGARVPPFPLEESRRRPCGASRLLQQLDSSQDEGGQGVGCFQRRQLEREWDVLRLELNLLLALEVCGEAQPRGELVGWRCGNELHARVADRVELVERAAALDDPNYLSRRSVGRSRALLDVATIGLCAEKPQRSLERTFSCGTRLKRQGTPFVNATR